METRLLAALEQTWLNNGALRAHTIYFYSHILHQKKWRETPQMEHVCNSICVDTREQEQHTARKNR